MSLFEFPQRFHKRYEQNGQENKEQAARTIAVKPGADQPAAGEICRMTRVNIKAVKSHEASGPRKEGLIMSGRMTCSMIVTSQAIAIKPAVRTVDEKEAP